MAASASASRARRCARSVCCRGNGDPISRAFF
jgi:hypothetical protein